MMTVQPMLAFAWNAAVGIPMLVVGLIVLALIWLFGQPRKEQGKRRAAGETHGRERREPTVGGSSLADNPAFTLGDEPAPAISPQQGELDMGLREELERLGATLSGDRTSARPAPLAGHAASIVDTLRAPSGEAFAALAGPDRLSGGCLGVGVAGRLVAVAPAGGPRGGSATGWPAAGSGR